MSKVLPPTQVFKLVKKKGYTTFVEKQWYISSRDGRVERVKCVRGGRDDDLENPPVFLPGGACMAFEFRLFDWFIADPSQK